MNEEYRHNNYVTEWYQRRFLPDGQSKHHYLDLQPDTVTKDGHTYSRKAPLRWGPSRCFAQHDVYTMSLGGLKNRDIEKFFFGEIDSRGKAAVDALLPFMSVQKLQTPKGLGCLLRSG